MIELRRIALTLKLIQHTEATTMARWIPEAYGYLMAGMLAKAESKLHQFAGCETIHPVNRSRAFSAASKIAALQCLDRDEFQNLLEQFRNEENENQP